MPFENSPSPGILTSIIRQLWGDNGGGVPIDNALAEDGDSSTESHNSEWERELEVSSPHPTGDIMTVLQPDSQLGGVTVGSKTKEAAVRVAEQADKGRAESPSQSVLGYEIGEADALVEEQADRGRAESPSQSALCDKLEDSSFTLENSRESAPWRYPDRLSDDASSSSLASEETVKWQHLKRCECDPELQMERGPPVQFNPGPPFATGDIVFCDVEEFGLRRGW